MGAHDHPVPGVDELLGRRLGLRPGARPALEVGADRVTPVRGAGLDGGQDDIGIEVRRRLGGIAAPLHLERERAAHDLDVLLGHPPQYPAMAGIPLSQADGEHPRSRH